MLKFKKNLSCMALLLGLLFLNGCISTGTKPSGFITSYDEFRDGPSGGVDKIWIDPKIKTPQDFKTLVAPYNKVMIDPIWISYANPEAYDGINPNELVKLSNLLLYQIEKALSGKYQIVSKPSPDTMKISMALTGVESPNRLLATTSSVLPIGLGISFLSKVTTGEHTNVGRASIEAVFSDSTTGKTLFAVIDDRTGNKDLGTIRDPLDDAKDAFKWWGERLKKTLVDK